jgi:hypothetical protein
MLGITWATVTDVSKLLGAPFGLALSTGDVDKFLLDKINKKLTYWATVHINPTDRGIIVNSVLNSATFFFLSVWGGTNKRVKWIKSVLLNYLAAGKAQQSRAKVGWIQCCQSKVEGGINIINPMDAVVVLMVKWVVKALEPRQSNLHVMLHYRLGFYQPYKGGQWQPSLDYFTISQHQAKQGSIVWNKVISVWKNLLPELKFVPPTCLEDLLSCSVWHCPAAPLIGPGFSKARAAALHKAGLQRYRDILVDSRLLEPDEVQGCFGLLQAEMGA